MDDDQQFCLRWNNHQSTLISVFDTLLENGTLVDCTLAAEGKFLKAHKVVLSACSPYFATLLQEQYDKHPIFILKDVKYQELRAMMDYMYRGEVNISQDQLAALLKAAESLQIKGLSDNRSGAPRTEHHRGLNVPAVATSGGASGGSGKISGGYTLEQTKRARIGPSSMDSQDLSGSREGSSSPSRRRRKIRRRSIENVMTEAHENSNSSQIQSNQSTLLQQSNANLAGVGAISAAASALATQIQVSAATLPTGTTGVTPLGANQGATQQLTTSVTKKTESVKGTSDAMNTDNVQAGAAAGADDQEMEHGKGDKLNHKHKSSGAGGGKDSELVIQPKSEYDEEGNEETVEDLTLDEEDMGMDDLDHNAGTSQGGEGSSQGYAAWQHDRSQDELLLATQDAQQRDPQDLSKRISLLRKENVAAVGQIQRSAYTRSILNTTSGAQRRPLSRSSPHADTTTITTAGTVASQEQKAPIGVGSNRKRLSVTDVSDMLFEFYKANVAKAPKNQQQSRLGQTSPTSAETHESSTIAAIATNGAAAAAAAAAAVGSGLASESEVEMEMETASKNLQGDEMMPREKGDSGTASVIAAKDNGSLPIVAASFHPRIKYTTKSPLPATSDDSMAPLTSIRTSVVVPTMPQMDIKPLIHASSGIVISPDSPSVASVIKQVPPRVTPTANVAGAIAVALLRDGYHSFQQQLRAQEILKRQINVCPQPKPAAAHGATSSSANATPTKILETFLRQHRENQQAESSADITMSHDATASDTNDGDDEDDSRYNGFEDIHLVEGGGAGGGAAKSSFNTGSLPNLFHAASVSTADEPSKFMITTSGGVFRNFEYPMSDYGGNNGGTSASSIQDGASPGNMGEMEPVYECRHCGKKYRWKSTLRRHENVECGGKEPSHQCPYCPYRSKQRGNLGVHVRKHHSHLPQLASKRRSKYSQKLEDHNSASSTNGGGSDDSQSRLIIDCSK